MAQDRAASFSETPHLVDSCCLGSNEMFSWVTWRQGENQLGKATNEAGQHFVAFCRERCDHWVRVGPQNMLTLSYESTNKRTSSSDLDHSSWSYLLWLVGTLFAQVFQIELKTTKSSRKQLGLIQARTLSFPLILLSQVFQKDSRSELMMYRVADGAKLVSKHTRKDVCASAVEKQYASRRDQWFNYRGS